MYINTVSHYIPEQIVPNSFFLDVNGLTDEWIEARTGIRERRKAGAEENTHTMGLAAIQAGLPALPYDPGEIDLIVGATYTPYDTVSTLAHAAQHMLDIDSIPAVTITSACSSLLNAIEIVEGYFAMNKASKALVVVSEHNTAYSRPEDPMSGHLWGDGAAALFISRTRMSATDLHIMDLKTAGAATVGKGIEGVVLRPTDGGISMPHGRDVFINACQYMELATRELLEKHHLPVTEIAHFIPHQANMRIVRNIAESMDLPDSKVVSNIQYLGNTGSAGCAIAMSENRAHFAPNDLIVVTVFGGGYSYGAMLVRA
ncbi:MAG: ketoacyl-ACP synthase III [Bacteroidia bacterium]|nr:ketoacyl-ACP synthase III [Bacteroidia bacterium]